MKIPDRGSARPDSFASFIALLAIVSVGACSGGADSEADDPAEPTTATVDIPADQLIRTADPFARGYTVDDFPRVKELAPGVYSYEQLRSAGEEMFTTVSMFVVTDDGVLVADGQGSVEETDRLIDHIAEITDQPIRTVVIASDHGDHTAGNSAFPEGVEFIAHPTSAAALEGMDAVPNATRTVADEVVLQMGDKEVRVLHLGRAHTGGDLVVHLPEESIIFMSEAYLHRVFPAMRSAYPSEWIEMIERAQAMDVETYVPGHGFVDHPTILADELELFQGAIRVVIDQARQLHEEGYGVEDAQQQAFFGDLEEWSLRESQGDRAIAQVYAEIDGTLPEPPR
ncbi:MAG: MBL fold metallo-hydrolase [Gemmatimonadetes bacterium]|nr:MBL fold metallo-hydrolase [Gemmatimonadota bacterium]